MKPKLREIRTQPAMEKGQMGIVLGDPLGLTARTLFVPNSLALLLTLMDGTRDAGTLRTGFELRSGVPLSLSVIEWLINVLDEALFLENERFALAYETVLRDYRSAPSRPPALCGDCYPADAAELSVFLQKYVDAEAGHGVEPVAEVRGIISPHIDFARGGPIYARVWSEARISLGQAELVVILGTDHNEGGGRITLTRQSYQTPWGIVPTAQDVVTELAGEIGEGAFEFELNHRREHSIETAIVWLHYMLGQKPCPVLPVICGSFHPFVERGVSPLSANYIRGIIEALRRLAGQRRTIVVAAADLAHQGPAFGDPLPLDVMGRARMARQDGELVDIMSHGRADDFWANILKEKDQRHVCGLPPIYIALSVLDGKKGTALGYAQCPASADGSSVVSICGIIY